MVKQHVYRRNKAQGRTVAASAEIQLGYWPALLERHAALYDDTGEEVPVYQQYQSERGLVVGRVALDPNGEAGDMIAHQFLLDDPEDIERLMTLRPLSKEAFLTQYVQKGGAVEPLPERSVEAITGTEALTRSYQALDGFFGDSLELLSSFLYALRLVSMDRYHFIYVRVQDEPRLITQRAYLMMELALKCLPSAYARRLGYRSYWNSADLCAEYPVIFTSRDTTPLSPAVSQLAIQFSFPEGTVVFPEDLSAQPGAQDAELAAAMLAHDINWVNRIRLKQRDSVERSPSMQLDIPPFEPGMSLTQYVSDWVDALEQRRSSVTDRAINVSIADWGRLESQIIRAGECMDSMRYLAELEEVISRFIRKDFGDWLEVPDRAILHDRIVLIDSIRWENVDITQDADKALIKRITDMEPMLRDKPEVRGIKGFQSALNACKLIHMVLCQGEDTYEEQLELFRELYRKAPALAVDVQNCLNWYVDQQCRSQKQRLIPDSMLMDAMLLGCVSFESGIADYHLLPMLERLIARECGQAALLAFQKRFAAHGARLSPADPHKSRYLWVAAMAVGAAALAALIYLFMHWNL